MLLEMAVGERTSPTTLQPGHRVQYVLTLPPTRTTASLSSSAYTTKLSHAASSRTNKEPQASRHDTVPDHMKRYHLTLPPWHGTTRDCNVPQGSRSSDSQRRVRLDTHKRDLHMQGLFNTIVTQHDKDQGREALQESDSCCHS